MRARRDQAAREIDEAWQGLKQALARIPPERMPERIEEGGVVGMWSVKDVIGHITTWENEAMAALQQYLTQRDVKVLAWSDLDAFNDRPELGLQPRDIGGSTVFVVPNPSPANAAYSLQDLVGWYRRLKELRDRERAR